MAIHIPILASSALIGVAAVIFGFTINSSWWDRKSFYINIASAVSGAFIGVPVAVLMISILYRKQSELEDWKRTRNLLKSAVADFIEAALPPIRGPHAKRLLSRLSLIFSDLTDYAKILEQGIATQSASGSYNERGEWESSKPSMWTVQHYANLLLLAQGHINVIIYDYKDQDYDLVTPEQYTQIASRRWEYLESYVRPRVLELKRDWLPNEIYGALQITGTSVSALLDAARTNHLEKLARWLIDWCHDGARNGYYELARMSISANVSTLAREAHDMEIMNRLCGKLAEYANSA